MPYEDSGLTVGLKPGSWLSVDDTMRVADVLKLQGTPAFVIGDDVLWGVSFRADAHEIVAVPEGRPVEPVWKIERALTRNRVVDSPISIHGGAFEVGGAL